MCFFFSEATTAAVALDVAFNKERLSEVTESLVLLLLGVPICLVAAISLAFGWLFVLLFDGRVVLTRNRQSKRAK